MLKTEVPDAVAPPILAVLAYGLWKFVRAAAPEIYGNCRIEIPLEPMKSAAQHEEKPTGRSKSFLDIPAKTLA